MTERPGLRDLQEEARRLRPIDVGRYSTRPVPVITSVVGLRGRTDEAWEAAAPLGERALRLVRRAVGLG